MDIELELGVFVGTGNEAAAKAGGEYAAEVAGSGAKAVWIGGVQGNTTSDEREAGFTAGLESGGVTVTVKQYGEGLGDKAASIMENVLTSSPDVSVVVTNNDDMAAGAARSVQAAGKDMTIVGFDGIKAGVQNVIDGTVTATVAQDPFGMGYKAVEAAVKTAKGEEVEDFIDTGSTVITSTSSTSFRKGRTVSAGVFGFSTTPARLPLAWILAMASWSFSSVSDSTWTVTRSAPASQNCSTYRPGSTIIR